jgi:hypothetical protein
VTVWPTFVIRRSPRLVVRHGDALGSVVELLAHSLGVLIGVLADPGAALASLGIIGRRIASIA